MTLTRACTVGSVILLAVLALYPLRAAEQLPQTPMTEDGFYMLTVARHLAAGHGVSYDGVHPTDGVQPAVLLLYTPAFLAGDPIVVPQRIVLAIELALFIVSALVCGRIASAIAPELPREAGAVATLAWLSSIPIFRHSFNGLETGLYLAGQLLLLLWIIRHRSRLASPWHALRLGVLLGILALVRVDAVFLVIGVALAYLIAWARPLAFLHRVRLGAIASGAAAMVAGGWFVRSWLLFGTVMPSSGAAQSQMLTPATNVQRLIAALAQPLFPALLPVSIRFSWYAAVWLALLCGAWAIVGRAAGRRVDRSAMDAWWPFCFAGAAWSLFYVFAFGAPHFIERYLAPLAVPLVPLVSVMLARALCQGRAAARLVGAAWVVSMGLALAEHAVLLRDSGLATRNWNFVAQYGQLATALPPGAIVGAAQSGTLGFFHPGTVNLDGKVNRSALVARRSGELWRYVDESDIEYLIDWPSVIEQAVGPYTGKWAKVGEAAGFEAWHRVRK